MLARHREPGLEGGSRAVLEPAEGRLKTPAGLDRQGANGDRDPRRRRSDRQHQEVLHSSCQNEDKTFVSYARPSNRSPYLTQPL